MVVRHNITVVKRQVGIAHVLAVHEHAGLVAVQKRWVEVLPSEHLLLLRVQQTGIHCYLVYLVTLRVVVGLDEFSGFDLLAALAVLKVVIMFVLHVEVECRIAEVLLRTEAFVPRQVLIEFRLRPPPLLVVLLVLA